MRTYSHVLLTWAAARWLRPAEPSVAAWGAAGATLPDLPAIAGVIWLGTHQRSLTRCELREKACEKKAFGGSDAVLHSALPIGVLLVLCWASDMFLSRGPLAFLLGWAGHVLADTLTHAEDARPILWPISRRCFRSPISHWEHSRYGQLFALAEHAVLLFMVARFISLRLRTT